jgi:molybdopterin molybdotransferase
VSEGAVELLAEVAAGQNVRHPGEDMRRGATVLEPGVRLGPAELGAAVAAGAGRLACARQPRVAVFCTGDELREPGEPLGPGEIHNSNAPMLAGLARRHGGLPDAVTRLPDTREATEQGLADGLERADVVIISGGVSVGPHDHVKPALATLGVEQRFWGVALQPGKPTWFGTRDERLVFGLPGNPVSAFVTFVLFVAPTLASLQGLRSAPAPRRVSLAAPVRRNRRREQAIRVVLEPQDGRLAARPNGPQGSHIVTSLVGADGLALIAAGEGEVEAGTEVPFLPL